MGCTIVYGWIVCVLLRHAAKSSWRGLSPVNHTWGFFSHVDYQAPESHICSLGHVWMALTLWAGGIAVYLYRVWSFSLFFHISKFFKLLTIDLAKSLILPHRGDLRQLYLSLSRAWCTPMLASPALQLGIQSILQIVSQSCKVVVWLK